jgi:hypothetical protein
VRGFNASLGGGVSHDHIPQSQRAARAWRENKKGERRHRWALFHTRVLQARVRFHHMMAGGVAWVWPHSFTPRPGGPCHPVH